MYYCVEILHFADLKKCHPIYFPVVRNISYNFLQMGFFISICLSLRRIRCRLGHLMYEVN